jgi:hypothetical protein
MGMGFVVALALALALLLVSNFYCALNNGRCLSTRFDSHFAQVETSPGHSVCSSYSGASCSIDSSWIICMWNKKHRILVKKSHFSVNDFPNNRLQIH